MINVTKTVKPQSSKRLISISIYVHKFKRFQILVKTTKPFLLDLTQECLREIIMRSTNLCIKFLRRTLIDYIHRCRLTQYTVKSKLVIMNPAERRCNLLSTPQINYLFSVLPCNIHVCIYINRNVYLLLKKTQISLFGKCEYKTNWVRRRLIRLKVIPMIYILLCIYVDMYICIQRSVRQSVDVQQMKSYFSKGWFLPTQ